MPNEASYSHNFTARDASILVFFPNYFSFQQFFSDQFFAWKIQILLTFSKLVTDLLKYFVSDVCSIGLVTVLLEYLDLYNDFKILFGCFIKIIRSFLFLMC